MIEMILELSRVNFLIYSNDRWTHCKNRSSVVQRSNIVFDELSIPNIPYTHKHTYTQTLTYTPTLSNTCIYMHTNRFSSVE